MTQDSNNPFRAALAKKERDGGWAPAGTYRTADGRGCLIASLPLNLQGSAEDVAFHILERVCAEQTGYPKGTSIIRAHNELPPEDLDRIMDKCAVAWDERI